MKTSPRWIVALALASRVIVLAVGLAATLAIGWEWRPGRFRFADNEFWNLPGRFDAGWYLVIARQGYTWNPEHPERQQNVAFFPAFPILMRVAGELVTIPAHVARDGELWGSTGNARVAWGGALVAIGCFLAACVLLLRLSAERLGDAAAGARAVILMCAYPFALYFSAPYSESLFLLAALGAFLAAERGQALPGAAWGLVAGLARSNGWVLTPALLVLVASKRSRDHRVWLSTVAPVAGALLFSVYVWSISGDALGWVRAQRAWNPEVPPLTFFTGRLDTIAHEGLTHYVRNDPVDAIMIVAVLFAAVTAGVAWWKLGSAYAVLVIAYLVPALALNIPSVGRMTSVLFPCFLGLATLLSTRQTVAIAAVWFPIQLWFAARFFTWQTPH